MHSSYTFTAGSAVFDEQNLVSAAGLVPVLELAEQTGLSRLIGEHVVLPSTRVKSGAVNPAGKLTSIIGAMASGADSIDDATAPRAGGTPRVFDEVYAPSTLGIFLREFTFGHSKQLAAVARAHLVALAPRAPLLAGADERMFLDIDSLLRPVYGHHKQGASFGHAKIASRALLRLSCPRTHYHLHGDRAAGDRRGAAAQRASRFRARRRVPAQAGHHHRPSDQPGRGDHGARRLDVRHEKGDRHLRGRRRRVLPVGEPQQAHPRRDRGRR